MNKLNLFFISILLLVTFLAIASYIDGGNVLSLEKSIFGLINNLPQFLYYPMLTFQFSGLLFAPVVISIYFLFRKKFAVALLLLLIPLIKIFLEKIIKANFQRERPAVYINDVIQRGDVQSSGLSFVSGHAMIVFAVVTFISPYLNGWQKIAIWIVPFGCIVARMYLGAHLPLDVFGGAIVGIVIGILLRICSNFINTILENRYKISNKDNNELKG